MSGPAVPWHRRPLVATTVLLALLAYIPALTAAPGRMPSDSKLYLYLDPGRFLGDAASTFDPRQFAGWVPHQHIAYLWPSGPWFWWFETIGVPDWIAHRLWIGTVMLAAGLGVRWATRLLGVGTSAALTAAVVYQVSPYVLPYVSRTSVMLLPWAGLGWIVALTVRSTRRGGWADPAALALVVLTVGAVNATALAMIVPAPVLWIGHEVWRRSITWRAGLAATGRIAVLSLAVSLWWIVMLAVQGRHGVDVLPYSESLADVSLTATSPEVWRSLGYWLFYVRDPYAATTTESLRYLSSTPAIIVSFTVPIVCLAGLVWVRWTHRRYALLLVVTGVVLAVGVHPIDDRSPLVQLLAGGDDSGLALALRSSTRALPMLALGLAFGAAALVDAAVAADLRRRRAGRGVAAIVVAAAVVNLPALWTGAFVDPALERDQDVPEAWRAAAAALDTSGADGRVLQLPGQEFGAYRWGYTVDQPLPGLTDKPVITRDLLPLGSAPAMDLLYALDDRMQDGTFEPESLAPVARLLGVDTVWVTNDSAFERFRTARPEVIGDLVDRAPGVARAVAYGEPFLNRPDVAMTDERAVGDPRVGDPLAPVELHALESPGSVVRAHARSVVVSGSGDGVVDAAAAGLIDGRAALRYSAALDADEIGRALTDAEYLVVTDSNRDRARHWRSSQDTTGHTEPGGPSPDVLRSVASDARLPVFASTHPDRQTVAEQRGVVRATASSYGEPFVYLPEHRAAMAVDGDPATSWIVGEHGDPIGEVLRLDATSGTIGPRLHLLQPEPAGGRRITRLTVSAIGGDPETFEVETFEVDLDDRSIVDAGQPIDLPAGVERVEFEIVAVGGGEPGTAGAVAGVGIAELGLDPVTEIVRPPHDALAEVGDETPLAIVFTRLRTDPMDRWRDDPEPVLVREFELPSARDLRVGSTVRFDARAPDVSLAELLGWPVSATTRLTGSLRATGAGAFDGDLETAWMTAFGAADGASVTVHDVDRPVAVMSIRQPVAGSSRITAVTVAGSGESHTVALQPDAGGTADVVVEPPLPAGTITITIAGIEPATTVDRRHADIVELPAAISEIVFDGAPRIDPTATVELGCLPLASIDGAQLEVSLTVSGDAWLDGAPVEASPCNGVVELDAGPHLVVGGGVPGLELDRIVLTDIDSPSPTPAPVTTTVARTRTSRTVDVDDCATGCWLVLGEGFSSAWSASVDGRSLDEPVLIDGGFNGWWLDGAENVRRVELRWTAQRPLTVALVLSMLAALGAAALVVHDRLRRRRHATVMAEPSVASPRLAVTVERLDRRSAVTAAAAWTIGAALLIGLSWAVWGAIAGLVMWRTGQRRLGELTAIAGLVVVGAGVTFVERRDAPLPNGGWPTTFESLHGLGMFVVVCLVVATIVADDAASESPPLASDDH